FTRSAKPASCDRRLTAEVDRILGQRHRHPSCTPAVTASQIETVSTLSRVEHLRPVIEPPRRESKAFERLGSFLLRQRVYEEAPRLLPGSTPERVVRGLHERSSPISSRAHARSTSSVDPRVRATGRPARVFGP